jgi:hypothetical protein
MRRPRYETYRVWRPDDSIEEARVPSWVSPESVVAAASHSDVALKIHPGASWHADNGTFEGPGWAYLDRCGSYFTTRELEFSVDFLQVHKEFMEFRLWRQKRDLERAS